MMCPLGCLHRYLTSIAFIFLLQAFAGAWLHAQSTNFLKRFLLQADSTNHVAVDSNYIHLPKQDWMLRPYLMYKFISTTVNWTDSSAASHQIIYRPNRPLQLGLLAGFQRFGIALALSIPGTSLGEDKYGKSRSFDGQLFLYARKWAADVTYAQYDGMYVNNPLSVDSSWTSSKPFPQRSDIGLHFFNANLIYIFNTRRFSFRATTQQIEEQRKSAGSFMLLGGFNIFTPDAEAPLIPDTLRPARAAYTRFHEARLMSLGIAPGYGYSLRLWRFVATPMLFLGPTLQRGWVATDEKDRDPIMNRLGLRSQFQGTVVYFAGRFFAGVQLRFDEIQYRKQDLSVSATQYNFRLFAGWRWQ